MDTFFCVSALDEVLGRGTPEIFNTDQGSQFTSEAFAERILGAEIRFSMDGRGRYLDNIFIERLWRSLKYEAIHLREPKTGLAGFPQRSASALGVWRGGHLGKRTAKARAWNERVRRVGGTWSELANRRQCSPEATRRRLPRFSIERGLPEKPRLRLGFFVVWRGRFEGGLARSAVLVQGHPESVPANPERKRREATEYTLSFNLV